MAENQETDVKTQSVIELFLGILRDNFGSSFKELWLFGSRARGDARDDSDYDMLVVVEGDLAELKRSVREAEWQCMEKLGTLVASIVYTPKIWNMAKHSPLGWNIQRGRKLLPS